MQQFQPDVLLVLATLLHVLVRTQLRFAARHVALKTAQKKPQTNTLQKQKLSLQAKAGMTLRKKSFTQTLDQWFLTWGKFKASTCIKFTPA